MESSIHNEYVLRGGLSGADRLRLLAAVKWPSTKALFERVGLCQGMSCLDIGCGSGAVTLAMAEFSGPTGRVAGLDLDETCLGLAHQEARQLGRNVEFRRGSAMDLDEERVYDLVFARFVLTHLREPGKALARMVGATRPGGLVVVEDIQFAGHFSFPASAAFDRYVNLYQEVVQRRGGDANIGPRLLGMFLDAGVLEIEFEVIQPTFAQGPGKKMAAVTMEHIRETVVEFGLANDEEINGIINELDLFAGDPRSMMSLPRIFQVWGRRT